MRPCAHFFSIKFWRRITDQKSRGHRNLGWFYYTCLDIVYVCIWTVRMSTVISLCTICLPGLTYQEKMKTSILWLSTESELRIILSKCWRRAGTPCLRQITQLLKSRFTNLEISFESSNMIWKISSLTGGLTKKYICAIWLWIMETIPLIQNLKVQVSKN